VHDTLRRMKAIIVEEVGKIVIRDVPEPEMGEYQARIKVVAGSICNSTDAKILHGEFAGPPPAVLGHEAVGRVVDIGPKVRNYKIGDMVLRPSIPGVPDMGIGSAFGSFVEYGLATDAWAQAEDSGEERPAGHDQVACSSDWDPQDLVQGITLKETLSFLHSFGVGKGHSLLIFGTGPVGVSFSLWGRYLGCEQVIVVGRRDAACYRAKEFGRATHAINNRVDDVPRAVRSIVPDGVTHAIEAIGDNDVLEDCLNSLAQGGQVGIYGVAPASQGRSPLLDDKRISSAGPCEALAHNEVMEQVRKGTIPSRDFLTHELDYTECARGFELLESREAFKVGLTFSK
jgi:threonine dehydrogenase-like Zn-dependent dehydrogenase